MVVSDLVLRRHLPMAFVDDLGAPQLHPSDERHLTKALRLGDGDSIGVSDGVGGWNEARLVSHATSLDVELVGAPTHEPAPTHRLTVGFTPVKGERPEWFVQKLTELGIDRIIPLSADRSVVRWDEAKATKLAARFEVTAREASMQCRRVWLPLIEPLQSVSSLSASIPLADPGGRPIRSDDQALLVGPEGGWSETETESSDLVALPGAILRAETAAITAGVMLNAGRDGLIGEAYGKGL